MNDLINITNRDGQAVVSSLEVAERFGKQHKHVLESIKGMTAENSALLEMFYKTEYTSAQNKRLPMYLMNRDGFSLLAMGFTGKEALAWKIKYIEAFNKMEETIRKGGMLNPSIEDECRKIRAEAMMINAKTRQFKERVKSVLSFNLSPVAKEVVGISLLEEDTGIKFGYRPPVETTYSATEIGAMLGVSAHRIGKLANDHGLKTEEYGITVLDKSRSSDKIVPTFRYNAKGVEKLRELVQEGGENE